MGYLNRGKWIRDEMFVTVCEWERRMCVCDTTGVSSMLRLMCRVVVLERMLWKNLDLIYEYGRKDVQDSPTVYLL